MVSIAGTTLEQLVTALVAELGVGQAFTATSASGAANTVVSTAMIDTEAPTEKYGGSYLYGLTTVVAGSVVNQQQRIKRNGFVGSSGTFTTAQNFTVNPPSGQPWLLSGTMPVLDADALTGMRTCVNRALRKLWVRVWHPLTGVDGQTEYDLGTLWWVSRDRFIRLMEPDPGGSGHPPIAGQDWDVVQNGDVWTLKLTSGYPTASVFWLVVDAPANYRLYLTGAWANQASPTAGLVLPADAALGPWNPLFQCALYECMKQLAIQAGGNRKAYWVGRVAEQRPVVSAIKLYQMDDDGAGLGEGPSAGTLGSDDPSKGLFSGGWGYF